MSKTIPRYVTRQKFREMCGDIPAATLRSDIKRKNVVEVNRGGNNVIDLQNQVNKEYLQRKQQDLEVHEITEAHGIDAKKKAIELEKAEEELRLKKIRRQQMESELIPTKLIYPVFQVHFKEAYQQAYFNTERWFSDFCKKHGISSTAVAKAKGELAVAMNEAIDKAKQSCYNQADTIIEDYRA